MTVSALVGAAIVTPDRLLERHALLIEDGCIAALVPEDALPPGVAPLSLGGGTLLPGFIDIQVNGGGDVLLNDAPTVATMARIAAAHRRFGTTGLMPTLLSDSLPVTLAAMKAADAAVEQGLPGLLGLHLEGPFLNPNKHGIHDPAHFRTLDDYRLALADMPARGPRIVTLAPELAPEGAIAELAASGVIVCGGHSLADYDQTRAALDQGLHGFTHLFNAMPPMLSRAPGMVGAALESRTSRFGLIADGHHVHPATMRAALHARGLDGVMLITDAMPPVGGTRDRFALMGREIRVEGGVCKGPDGTLGGSVLSMAQAVRNAQDWFGLDWVRLSRLASGNAAEFLRLHHRTGAIRVGLSADLVHLDAARRVTRSWIAGARSDIGETAPDRTGAATDGKEPRA